MPVVTVPGVGNVTFPDSMSQQDIIKAIETDILPQAKPPKQAGFFSSLLGSAKELGDAPAAARFATANTEEEKQKARSELNKPPTEATTSFEDVISGKGKFSDWFKQTAGSSAGALAAPAAAAGATLLTPAAPLAPAVGAAVLGAQYLTGGLGRQAQEQERAIQEGRAPEETSVGKAAAAAAGQTALDVIGFKFFKPVFSAFPVVGKMFGEGGEKATKKAVEALTDAFEKGKLSYAKGVASGVGKGVAFEMPQEIAQTALERWQAGLSLTDAEARREYVEAGAGALLLGSTLGGASGGIKTAADRSIAQRVIENKAERESQRLQASEEEAQAPATAPATQETTQETTQPTTEAPRLLTPEAITAVKDQKIRERADELLGAGVVSTPQEAVALATQQINIGEVADETARRAEEAAPPITSAQKAAGAFEGAQPDLLGHFMPERSVPTQSEFALTAPQAPNLQQQELPLEPRQAAPEVSPAQLTLPFFQPEAQNVPSGPKPDVAQSAVTGESGQRVVGESIPLPVQQAPSVGERTADAGAVGVGSDSGPVAGLAQREAEQPDTLTPQTQPESTLAPQPEPVAQATPAQIRESRKQARQLLKAAGLPDTRDTLDSYSNPDGTVDLTALQNAFESGYLLQSEKGATAAKADTAFEGFRTAQAALRHILKTGNAFESLLASRLLPNVINVRIKVIKPGETVPDFIKDKFDSARGLYVEIPETGVKTVYLHSSKFGDGLQGVNSRTILHEILHAATAFKLKIGLARISPDSNVSQVAGGLNDLMQYTREEYIKSGARLGIPAVAFNDVREFVTYGMTDPKMQEFLVGVKGRKESGFSRFVAYIRQLFGMGPEHHTAMSNLISMTDQLISARATPAESRIGKRLGPMKIEYKKVEALAQKAEAVRDAPTTAPEKVSLISEALKVRDFDQFKELMGVVIKGTASELRPTLLKALNMTELAKLMTDNLKDSRLPQQLRGRVEQDIQSLMENVRKVEGAKNQALRRDGELLREMLAFRKTNKKQSDTLMRLVHMSTVKEADVSTEKGREKDKELASMWGAIGPVGRSLYVKLKDNYKSKLDRFFTLQEKVLMSSGMSQDNLNKALATMRARKADIEKHGPYFPLMRFGRYWVRIGEGADKKFYMFESAIQRNLFLKEQKKNLGDSASIQPGDGYAGAFKDANVDPAQLALFRKAIADKPGLDAKEKADMLDAVEQMWLMALPDRSARKQFIHRGNVPGYSEDAIRSFATTAVRSANQLARIEFGKDSLGLMADIKSGLANSANRPVIDAYINEMTQHTKDIVAPKDEEQAGAAVAGAIKQFTFLYYLTSPASALVNLSSIPVFVIPVLQTRFQSSTANTWATVWGNAKKVMSKKGVTDANGKFTAPTLKSVLTGDELKAFKDAEAQGILQDTVTADMAGLREEAIKGEPNMLRSVTNGVSFLFQTSERVMREIAYVSAYQLARKKMPHEAAVRKAIDAVHESLGDFSVATRASMLKSPVMQVAFQFKQFSKFTTFYLVNNAMEMFKGASPEIKKAAMTRLIGALGMTALAAGVTGLPMYSAIMFAIDTAYNLLKDDDEPPMDADREFRQFLYELTDSKLLTRAALSGPISVASDIDLHGRLSMNDLWFRDPRQSLDEEEAARNFIVQMLGPSVGLSLGFARGVKLLNDGEVERAWEAFMPSVLRNLFVAGRYATEGAKTARGDVLLAPEELSAGNLLWQAFGFSPSTLADLQQANVKATGLKLKILKEKTDLVKRLYDETADGDSEGVSSALEAIMAFNQKYPAAAITSETIRSSLRSRAKAQAESIRGVRAPGKLRDTVLSPFEYARPD